MRVVSKLFIPAFLFSSVVAVYLHNLSQSVYGGDVGDLVTAAFVGGVPHPSGYPLFTFLGFLLTRIHFFPSPAFAVGLISTFSGALGAVLFYLTIKRLTKSNLIAFISSLILSFSYFFWFYSEIADVFALNSFFLIALLFLTIKIIKENSIKIFPLFFFVLGLSLTNHQSIVLILPSLSTLLFSFVWRSGKKKKISMSIVLQSIITFALGLLVYFYIPLASLHHPVINWDNVKDIQSFLHLVLRRDYGTFSAGFFAVPSFLQRLIVVKSYLSQIVIQLTIPVVVVSILGIIYLFIKNRLLVTSLLVGFLLSGPLFIGYAGFPLTGGFYFGVNERFFLLSVVFFLYFFPFGLLFLSEVFEKYLQRNAILLQIIFLIIPVMLFVYNFPKTNLSNVFIGDYYGKDVLNPLPHNAIVFLAGDTIIFNTWYTQYALGVRPDVHTLNINGNIGSPYYTTLENKYKLSHPYASQAQILNGIIDNLPHNGSVFSVEELQPTSGKKFTWIPYGLLFQLVSPDSIPTEEEFTQKENSIWKLLHIPSASDENNLALGNLTISDIPKSYANIMLITGNFYLSQYRNEKKAKEWYDKALLVSHDYDKTYSSLGVYYLTVDKQCALARDNFTKAIEINPVESLNYFLLYTTYQNCLHDNKGANNLKLQYEKQFHTSFSQAFGKIQKGNKK